MNDVVQGALIAALSALGGVLITQIGNVVIEKRRELASYRVNLYAKRLEVHQEAYRWLLTLIEWLRSTMEQPPDEIPRLFHQRLDYESKEARKWWDANCLYLDDSSRALVVRFIEIARAIADQEDLPEGTDPIRVYRDVLGAIQTGIGMKHIEERKVEPVDR